MDDTTERTAAGCGCGRDSPPAEPAKTRRERDEERTPLWVKLFGGTAMSIAFISVATLAGYIVNNVSNLQLQINECVTKKEFGDRHKSLWDGTKAAADSCHVVQVELAGLKERLASAEAGQRKLAEEVQSLHKDNAAMRERLAATEGKTGRQP